METSSAVCEINVLWCLCLIIDVLYIIYVICYILYISVGKIYGKVWPPITIISRYYYSNFAWHLADHHSYIYYIGTYRARFQVLTIPTITITSVTARYYIIWLMRLDWWWVPINIYHCCRILKYLLLHYIWLNENIKCPIKCTYLYLYKYTV